MESLLENFQERTHKSHESTEHIPHGIRKRSPPLDAGHPFHVWPPLHAPFSAGNITAAAFPHDAPCLHVPDSAPPVAPGVCRTGPALPPTCRVCSVARQLRPQVPRESTASPHSVPSASLLLDVPSPRGHFWLLVSLTCPRSDNTYWVQLRKSPFDHCHLWR